MNDPRLIAFIVILAAIIGLLALFPPFKEMSNTAAVRRHNPWKGHPIRASRLIWSCFHTADDPFVPNTDIPRVKALSLGERNIGFLENEIDDLIDALAALRDAPEVGAHTTQVFLTDSKPGSKTS